MPAGWTGLPISLRGLTAAVVLAAGVRARLYILRVKKQSDLGTRQKFWKVMAITFARDAMIFLIVRRSKLSNLEAKGAIAAGATVLLLTPPSPSLLNRLRMGEGGTAE